MRVKYSDELGHVDSDRVVACEVTLPIIWGFSGLSGVRYAFRGGVLPAADTYLVFH